MLPDTEIRVDADAFIAPVTFDAIVDYIVGRVLAVEPVQPTELAELIEDDGDLRPAIAHLARIVGLIDLRPAHLSSAQYLRRVVPLLVDSVAADPWTATPGDEVELLTAAGVTDWPAAGLIPSPVTFASVVGYFLTEPEPYLPPGLAERIEDDDQLRPALSHLVRLIGLLDLKPTAMNCTQYLQHLVPLLVDAEPVTDDQETGR